MPHTARHGGGGNDDSGSERTRTVTSPSFDPEEFDSGDSDDSDSGGSPGGSSPPPSDVGGPATGDDSGGGGSDSVPNESITRDRPNPTGADDNPADPGGTSDKFGTPNESISRTRPDPTGEGSQSAAGSGSSGRQPQGSNGQDAASDTNTAVERVTGAAGDAAAAIREFGQDAREFQRETTPVRDAGAAVRDRLGLPSESELATGANELIGDAAGGVTPREARLRARGEAITGLREGADVVEDTVPGGRETLTGAAVVAAAAEPTPVGEALLFGTGTAGALGGSAASNPEQGDELVPDSPFTQPEINTPSDPATQQSELGVTDGTDGGEIGVPDDPATLGGADELPTPQDPTAQVSELDVPSNDGRDLSTIRAAQLIGRQEGRERDPNTDRFRRDRDDELQEILSGGGTLGEVEESGEPTVDDGGRQFEDVPEDFTSRPTGFEGFEPDDSGVGEPTFPETDRGTGVGSGGTQPPTLPPLGRQDTSVAGDGVGQGQPTGQTPGSDVFTTPDIDTDFDFGVDQPTPTRPRPDFATPTPTTNQTDNPTRFGQPDPTTTPRESSEGQRTRRRRPRFDSDTDRDEEPMFLFQSDAALLDSGITSVDELLDADRDGLL